MNKAEEKRLKAIAEGSGPLAKWAAHTLANYHEARAASRSPATPPEPQEPPKTPEPVRVTDMSLCAKCGKPHGGKRVPFHLDASRERVVFYCRPCADEVWRERHGFR